MQSSISWFHLAIAVAGSLGSYDLRGDVAHAILELTRRPCAIGPTGVWKRGPRRPWLVGHVPLDRLEYGSAAHAVLDSSAMRHWTDWSMEARPTPSLTRRPCAIGPTGVWKRGPRHPWLVGHAPLDRLEYGSAAHAILDSSAMCHWTDWSMEARPMPSLTRRPCAIGPTGVWKRGPCHPWLVGHAPLDRLEYGSAAHAILDSSAMRHWTDWSMEARPTPSLTRRPCAIGPTGVWKRGPRHPWLVGHAPLDRLEYGSAAHAVLDSSAVRHWTDWSMEARPTPSLTRQPCAIGPTGVWKLGAVCHRRLRCGIHGRCLWRGIVPFPSRREGKGLLSRKLGGGISSHHGELPYLLSLPLYVRQRQMAHFPQLTPRCDRMWACS